MAYTVTANIPLNMPTPGTREPAQIALLNDNCVVLSNHDHTTGKALAVGRLRSGPAASRPTASSAGNVYFATDTGLMSVDNGTAWVDFITNQGQVNLTDPIIRDTLQFGAKPNGAVDYTVRRVSATGMQFSGNVGVGVAPAAWGGAFIAAQVGGIALMGNPSDSNSGYLLQNSYWDGSGFRALYTTNSAGLRLSLAGGALTLSSAPSVAAGAAQTFTTRLTVDQAGNMRLGAAAPSAWGVPYAGAALQIGQTGALMSHVGAVSTVLGSNTYYDGANSRAIVTGAATQTQWSDAGVTVYTAPSVAAGAVQTFAGRMAVNTVGTVTITPDAGQPALTAAGEIRADNISGYGGLNMFSRATFMPAADNTYYNGAGSYRWVAVYATNGTIQTSSADLKQDITPLDPAACSRAVLDTEWVSFRYRDPAFSDPEPLPGEDEGALEQRTAEQYANYLARLEETAFARKQRGYVLGAPDHRVSDLFGLSDRRSASPSSDLAVVACALQSALQRIAALETTVEALNATA